MKQRRIISLLAGVVVAAAGGATTVALAPPGDAAVIRAAAGPLAACADAPWAEGTAYPVGARVTYQGRTYRALVAHTAAPGSGWNPAAAPSLWADLGACTGGARPSAPPQGQVFF